MPPAPAASSSTAAPTEAPAARLARQADARLQALLDSVLQQSRLAGDASAALSQRIQQQQDASVASATAASCRVFALADQRRHVVLRDVAKLNGLDPLDPQPMPFDQAVESVNTSLHDPLLAKSKSVEEIARELVGAFRVGDELPRFPLPLPTPPAHDPAASHH